MGSIRDLGRAAWRKFITDGVPSSGAHRPTKDDIHAFVDAVDAGLGIDGVEALKASASRPNSAYLLGQAAAGDGAARRVFWDADASDTANDIDVIAPTHGAGRYKVLDNTLMTALWFGAKRDGTSAAATTAAFQAYNDYLVARGGGDLFVPDGTYTVKASGSNDHAFTLGSGVRLVGQSRDKTIIQQDTDQGSKTLLKIEQGASRIVIENLTLDGRREEQSAATGDHNGIMGAAGVSHVSVNRVNLKNFYSRSISTNGDGLLTDDLIDDEEVVLAAQNWTLFDITVTGADHKSILGRRTLFLKVFGCHVETIPNEDVTSSRSGIEISRCEHVTINVNTISHPVSTTGVGIRVVNGSRHVTATGNTIKRGLHGLMAANVSYVTFDANIIEFATNAVLVQSTDNVTGFDPPGDVAWQATYSIHVKNNQIIEPVTVGVIANEVDGASVDELHVTGNFVKHSDTMNYGLRISLGTVTAYQAGNTVTGSVTANISGTWLAHGQDSGTWTATLGFSTSNGDLNVSTPTINSGYWWRIGRLVFWKLTFRAAISHSTASGSLRILGAGLPVSKNDEDSRGLGHGRFGGFTKTNYTQYNMNIIQGTANFGVQASGSGQGISTVDAANVTASGTVDIEMSGFYETVSSG